MRAEVVDVGGHPVFTAAWDGPGDGPAFVLLHGLGGMHTNWFSLAPLLAARGPVVALDMAGFGRTPLHRRAASLEANAELVARFVRQEVGRPAILVGNSMGGTIAIMRAAAAPETVGGLVLIDPALPRAPGARIDPLVAAAFAAYMVPGLGERMIERRLATLGPEEVARQTLALCTVDAARVDADVVRAQIEVACARAAMPWATTAFLQAARSLVRMLARRARMAALIRDVCAPALLVMGREDRLVNIVSAEHVARMRPDWDLVVLDDCGHVPQLERPAETFAAIARWLDGPAARVIGSARAG